MKKILFTLALLISFNSFGQTAEQYFEMGKEKNSNKNYNGAILDYTRAIEMNPNYYDAYIYRADLKLMRDDFYGAIADYTRAIEIDPNNSYTAYNYSQIAFAKSSLKDYKGALADYNKAIELRPDIEDYKLRGITKFYLKDYYGAIADYTKSIEIYDFNSITFEMGVYELRGNAKKKLGDLNGACEDYKKAVDLGSTPKLFSQNCN